MNKTSSSTGPIPPGTKANFMNLKKAFGRDEVCAMQVIDRTTGDEATLVCAVHGENGEVVLTPFAVMVGADVYERYEPQPVPEEERDADA